MGTHPEVKVTKLEKRPDGSVGPTLNLGAETGEQLATQTQATILLRAITEKAENIFLLEWKGNKIPRGATVAGHIIAWTQNGLVTSDQGQYVGTYERLVEFGGVDHREQKILIFVG